MYIFSHEYAYDFYKLTLSTFPGGMEKRQFHFCDLAVTSKPMIQIEKLAMRISHSHFHLYALFLNFDHFNRKMAITQKTYLEGPYK